MNDKDKIARLWGAIETFLDGETQGNVLGLRQALAQCAPEVKTPYKGVILKLSDANIEKLSDLRDQGFVDFDVIDVCTNTQR